MRRRRFTAKFKAQVALEALRGERTINEVAAQYEIHPTQITKWKREAIDGLAEVFTQGKGGEHEQGRAREVKELHAKIGQLVVERDFLAKASGH